MRATMKSLAYLVLSFGMILASPVYGEDTANTANVEEAGIDYLALVNKLNPLPDGWEDALKTVTITNSLGDEVEVEAKAYAAYELLKADLEENDGIYVELDSARVILHYCRKSECQR